MSRLRPPAFSIVGEIGFQCSHSLSPWFAFPLSCLVSFVFVQKNPGLNYRGLHHVSCCIIVHKYYDGIRNLSQNGSKINYVVGNQSIADYARAQ